MFSGMLEWYTGQFFLHVCVSYANNKVADQPAHPRSLISAFVVRCLDSVMSLVSVTKISSLMLASVAEQASLSLTWSETPEDTFSHVVAHVYRSCLCAVIYLLNYKKKGV